MSVIVCITIYYSPSLTFYQKIILRLFACKFSTSQTIINSPWARLSGYRCRFPGCRLWWQGADPLCLCVGWCRCWRLSALAAEPRSRWAPDSEAPERPVCVPSPRPRPVLHPRLPHTERTSQCLRGSNAKSKKNTKKNRHKCNFTVHACVSQHACVGWAHVGTSVLSVFSVEFNLFINKLVGLTFPWFRHFYIFLL